MSTGLSLYPGTDRSIGHNPSPFALRGVLCSSLTLEHEGGA